ncbi:MAG TPA: hypothetical protein PKA98_19675, partial [Acidimicrobiales bacterium]|nr:hypothetical protein [Acidimicrobiales bacterium]
FGAVEIDGASAPVWVGADADEAAGFLKTTGMGRVLFAEADDAVVAEAMARAADAVRPHETADGIELAGAAWIVRASA